MGGDMGRFIFFSFIFSFTLLSVPSFAGDFPSCPKGTVWDGIQCISTCPAGYEWNDEGKCVKKTSDPASAAVCKKSDNFFQSASTGCRQQSTWLVFGNRSAKTMSYRDARRYCDRIEAGKKDWRLPTAEELSNIAGQTVAAAYLDFETNAWFWTSNYYEDYDDEYTRVYQKQVNLYRAYEEFRFVKSYKGQSEDWNTSNQGYVVCVRADE